MSEPDDALADDAQALLSAYRVDEGLPPAVRARVWARVDRSVHAEVAPPPVATVVPAAAHARWAVLGLAVAAAVAAIWWGRVLVTESPSDDARAAAAYDRDDERSLDTAQDADAPDDATTARSHATPGPTPALPPALPPALAPVDPPAAASADPPAAPRTSPRPAPRAAPVPAPAVEIDHLADETELLRAATSALARKDARHALALLDAGKRRFGTGVLAEERAALRVLALCELGQRSKARRDAEAFAAAHPASPLRSRVRSACADETP